MASAVKGTFEGIFVALATPMTADQEVHYDGLRSLIEHMIDQGVHGIIPLGSTGEYYALSPQERQAVASATIDAVAGRVPVVVGVSSTANTPGEVSVTVPTKESAVPALEKSAASTVPSSMSSLKVTV